MAEPSFELAPDHPVFVGHFPGRPIVPGVMLLDWVLREASQALGRAPAEIRVREAKFFTPLAPAQRAALKLELSDARGAFDIRCGDVVIARGVLEWNADA